MWNTSNFCSMAFWTWKIYVLIVVDNVHTVLLKSALYFTAILINECDFSDIYSSQHNKEQ